MNEASVSGKKKMDKLSQLTGRQSSLKKIEPYLTSENEEEAMKNGEMIRKSDRVTKITGDRPSYYHLEDDGEVAKKVDIMNKKFGERSDYDDALNVILAKPENEEEAVQLGKQLRSKEKLNNKFGETL